MVDPARIYQGLVARGLPEVVAQGILANIEDESGFRTDINEIAPVVPGSRGGFGLIQWTGPRRNALEAYAASAGKPVDDLDVQLDFLVQEARGPEKRNFDRVLAAGTPAEAASAFATHFLRPAPEHLSRRVAEYTGGNALADYANLGTPVEPARPEMNALAALALTQPQGGTPSAPPLWMGHDISAFLGRRA